MYTGIIRLKKDFNLQIYILNKYISSNLPLKNLLQKGKCLIIGSLFWTGNSWANFSKRIQNIIALVKVSLLNQIFLQSKSLNKDGKCSLSKKYINKIFWKWNYKIMKNWFPQVFFFFFKVYYTSEISQNFKTA